MYLDKAKKAEIFEKYGKGGVKDTGSVEARLHCSPIVSLTSPST